MFVKTFSRLVRAASALLLAAGALPALAAIPAAERDVLTALYTSTNGAGWTNHTNWNGAAGTECTWYGVTCDAGQTHVIAISLYNNNLAGALPATLNDLTQLQFFQAISNHLTGAIPSLAGLTALVNFAAADNQLTGPIPSLSGLTALGEFQVSENQLSGPIPSLAGLSLGVFNASNNQLTGSIPSLAGLALTQFYVDGNQLTGPLPAAPASLQFARVCPNTSLSANPNAAMNTIWRDAVTNNGYDFSCVGPAITATAAAAAVPTLETAGLALLALLLAGGAAARMRRS